MKKIVVLLLFSGWDHCYSQEEIETDRPDQTECASVAQPGSVQLETGFLYTNDKVEEIAGRTEMTLFNYGTTLLRIGVFKQTEFRLEAGQYETTDYRNDAGSSRIEGFSPFVIGTKIAVCEEKGILPKIAFIGHLQLPVGNEKLITKDEVLPSFSFSLAHTLSERFSLGYNLGMEWGSGSTVPVYFYTLTVGAGIAEKCEVFIETFGDFSKGQLPQSYFDLGAGYLPRKNLKFDVSGGIALNENSADLFLSAGFSIRLPH
jgi:hypothetical protein